MLILFRKDWRLLRPILLAALGLAAIFLVLLPAVQYYGWAAQAERRGYVYRGTDRIQQLGAAVLQGAWFMWVAVPVLCAAIGGAAFATERRERWGDLLGLLPVPRWRVVASKLCVSGLACLMLLTLNQCVIHGAALFGLPSVEFGVGRLAGDLLTSASVAMLLFGTAWLLSAVLASPALATGVAVGVEGGAYLWFVQAVDISRWAFDDSERALQSLNLFAAGVGLTLLIAGTIVQLLRRSP